VLRAIPNGVRTPALVPAMTAPGSCADKQALACMAGRLEHERGKPQGGETQESQGGREADKLLRFCPNWHRGNP
jgi:hypothetical protein